MFHTVRAWKDVIRQSIYSKHVGTQKLLIPSRCSKWVLHWKCVIGMQPFPSVRVSVPITGELWGDMSGYVTENEGNRCAQERTFNVKIAPAERIKWFWTPTYRYPKATNPSHEIHTISISTQKKTTVHQQTGLTPQKKRTNINSHIHVRREYDGTRRDSNAKKHYIALSAKKPPYLCKRKTNEPEFPTKTHSFLSLWEESISSSLP